jgi:uncharacterized protein YPO0396
MLGIRSEQALELFHQTVSMKSVGNLNEFVRSNMLEPVDASEKVAGIVSHFDDLRKAHEAVRRAEDQLAALEPLVATADRYDSAFEQRTAMERERDAVRLYFAELRMRLLSEQAAANEEEREQRAREVEQVGAARSGLTRARESLIGERAAAGGDRLGELERIEQAERTEVTTRRERRDRFTSLVADAGLEPVGDEAGFAMLPERIRSALEQQRQQRSAAEERLAELVARGKELERSGEQTRTELASLAGRRNNLPSSSLDLRAQLCQDLGLDPQELPFAGELVDVGERFTRWRGAAERVLRGFALSLLVPQEHYPAVAQWVDGRRLTSRDEGGRRGMRLVYERVPRRQVALQPPSSPDGLLLVQTLELAPGPFEGYLRDQLARRADHRCAESLQEFHAASRAVTPAGQIRSGDRHEKDDRSRIDDPRTWVLGWANERKIEALTVQLTEQQAEFSAVRVEQDQVAEQRQRIADRTTVLQKLEEYSSWRDLDWQAAQARVDDAQQERARLLAGSSRLEELERQLATNQLQGEQLDARLEALRGGISVLVDRIRRGTRAREEEAAYVAGRPADVLAQARQSYAALAVRLGSDAPADPDGCQRAAADLTAALQQAIDRAARELGGYAQSLLSAMNEVRRRWPEATTEMDASLQARAEFRSFRDRVAQDDLPAFEAEFKRQLNTNTIRELAGFNSWLRRQADDIHARVDRINEALGAIDYSPGRYITLVAERTVNQEVQAFRSELRAATDDTLGPDDDRYSEQRFLEVQRILERFRGREHYAEADKAWTRRVTDVRNWFTFSASERVKDTGEEWEHYRDSDGKSGGQKEKLAYTILAASLAYQFGLEWGVERSRDFRFAVIDEAFGRGSDASTRYALDLFAKLGLQLLIVTPLQKVHVIEPYVRAIGFVDNPTGSCSRLQTLTIEEFRARREGPTRGA